CHELVEAHLICLDRVPREVKAAGTLLAWAHPVFPPISRHKVATGVANNRDAKLAHKVEDVAPKTIRVGGWVARLVNAGVDAAPQMLSEGAKEITINGADAGVG